MATDRNTLKGWFVRGAKPLATQFAAWIDSFWHKDDPIPIQSIEGLSQVLVNKADTEVVGNLITQAIANQQYPEASLLQKGIVQLSSTASLTDETMAATPKLVSSMVNNSANAILNEVQSMISQTGMEEATYAQMVAKVSGGSLVPGMTYKITDRGDRGIIIRAVSESKLGVDGVRFMLCPATYAAGVDSHGNNWIGVWRSTKTATVNCLTIWNGKVWKNLTGVIGYQDGLEYLDNTNWQVVEKATFANHEYVEMVFGCRYDFENDWVFLQWDNQGNIFGNGRFDGEIENTLNYCDISDWNMATSGCLFEFNRCGGITGNEATEICHNSTIGLILGNHVQVLSQNTCWYVTYNVCEMIYQNNITGAIYGNTGPNIVKNTNIGDIAGNTVSGKIWLNSNNGDIKSNNVQDIERNSNNGSINNNANGLLISNNGNAGAITYNNCTGNIWANTNGGEIDNNVASNIWYNSNSKSIDHCQIGTGYIQNNKNNGVIRATSSTPKNIYDNANNGDIQGVITSDIYDGRVDKPQ